MSGIRGLSWRRPSLETARCTPGVWGEMPSPTWLGKPKGDSWESSAATVKDELTDDGTGGVEGRYDGEVRPPRGVHRSGSCEW